MTFLVIAGGCVLAAAGAALMLKLRAVNRGIWQTLWAHERDAKDLRDRIVDLRRQLLLSRIGKLRLPALLPAQHGEDLILFDFFQGRRNGVFVEVGAYDGVNLSNTYFLEALGWNGVLVEANPERYRQCVASRPFSRSVHAAAVSDGSVREIVLSIPIGDGGLDTLAFTEAGEAHKQRVSRSTATVQQVSVPALTLDEILAPLSGPIDVMSIDIEGGELAALKGLDLQRFRPTVLIIEDNSAGRETSVKDYLAARGYAERMRLGANVFYLAAGDARVLKRPEDAGIDPALAEAA